jgi:hypothetical protein
MSKFSDLTTSIVNRLSSAPELAGITILAEDVGDMQTQIDTAMGNIGMCILVGQPWFENKSPLSTVTNAAINTSIAIGEVPTVWRADGKPVCTDVVQDVTRYLQHFKILGFEPLRVNRASFIPNKERQLYELAVETVSVFSL